MNCERTMFSRKPLTAPSDDDRPQKRQKAEVASLVVSALIENGTAHYSNGEHDSAAEFFNEALSYLDIGYLRSQNRTKDPNTSITSKQASTRISCGRNAECQQPISSTSVNNEYDEGMRVYSCLLQIEETISEHALAGILYYNLAQTYVERRLYKEAMRWFHRALDRFLTQQRGRSRLLWIVENLHSLAYCFYQTGNESEAKDFYQRALELVSDNNLGDIHMAASLNCVGVILFNNKQDQENTHLAMDMFRKSLELYRSCSNAEIASIATVLNNIGRVHYVRSKFGKAIKCYEDCLRLRRQSCGDKSIDVSATAYNLGQSFYQLGRFDKALYYYQESLKIMISVAGLSSKDVALVFRGIGEIYEAKANHKMAIHYFQKSLNVLLVCYKRQPTADVAVILNKLGHMSYEVKDFSAAMKHYQESLIVEKDILAPNHPHIVLTITNIGHIHKQLGEYDKGLSAYETVYAMQRETFGDNSLVLAETVSSIALMQYHLKHYEASFDSYQEALRIRREHLGCEGHPEIASTLNSIGLVLFKQDMFELAKSCFMESLRIRSKLLGKDHRDVAILWYNIATIHFETGEDDLAIQMYKETLRIERRSLGNDHPDVVLTLRHLAQVHHQLGHTDTAIEYFREALEIELRRKEPAQLSLARILNLLGNVYLQLGRTDDMMKCYVESSRIYESSQVSSETLRLGGYSFYGLSKTNPPCAPAA